MNFPTVIGYQSTLTRSLHCIPCTDRGRAVGPRYTLMPITAEDLSEGGICSTCGTDILIDPKKQQ